jgi:WD40 repeat protein
VDSREHASPDPLPGGLPTGDAKRLGEFTGREWVFEEIAAWLAGEEQVFLLVGEPGSGKSLIAARLVELSRGSISDYGFAPGFLTYAHFCRALDPAAVDPLSFVDGLSNQLARLSPAFEAARGELRGARTQVTGTASAEMAAPGSTLVGTHVTHTGELSAELVFARDLPFGALREDRVDGPLVVLIDALDESLTFTGRQREAFVRLLRAVRTARLPLPLRLLVTTRPDPRVLESLGPRMFDLEADAPADAADVLRYARRRLAHLPDARGHAIADAVVDRGGGNFLYARYVLDELGDEPDVDPAALDLPEGLEEYYRGSLERELARTEDEWERYRPLLALLAVARGEGLTPLLLRASGLTKPEVERALRALRQYLAGDGGTGPFRLYHQSFRDFLRDDSVRSVDTAEADRTLAEFVLAEYGDWDGADWDSAGYERAYALAHLPAHLAAAVRGAELRREREELGERLVALLGDFAFLEAKTAFSGIDNLLSDLADARDALPRAFVLRHLGRVFDREAHNLRRWARAEQPSLFAQEVHNRAVALGLPDVAARAAARLDTLGLPALRLRWRAAGESPVLLRVLEGHGGPVNAVGLTGDGRAVSASDDATLRVWDLASGRELALLVGHDGPVNAVALAGGRAVSASDDATLRVWDLASGHELALLAGHEAEVRAVALTEDGRVVSGSADATLRVWDLESGRELAVLSGHQGSVSVVLVIDEGRAISAAWDSTLRLWDLKSPRELGVLADGADPRSIAVTPDEHVVFGFGDDLSVTNLASGRQVALLPGDTKAVTAIALTADGRVVSGSRGRRLLVGDLEGRREVVVLEGHQGPVTAVSVTGDGRAVSASEDRTLRVWDIESGRELAVLGGHDGEVTAIALTSDGRAVSAAWDGTLRVWDLEIAHGVAASVGHTDLITDLALTGDGRAVSASYDRTIRIWDLESGRELGVIADLVDPSPLLGGVETIALTGDGRALSASTDAVPRENSHVYHEDRLHVWDLDSCRELAVHPGYRGQAVALTDDGRALSASEDHTLRLWDLASGAEVAVLPGHTGEIYAVVLISDGRAVSAASDGTVRLWDIENAREIALLTGQEGNPVAFTDDGRVIFAWPDTTLRVWDLVGGRELAVLAGHERPVGFATPGPGYVLLTDDGRAVSVSSDRTLRVWDLERGREIAVFRGHESDVTSFALTQGGRAVSAAWDGMVSAWSLQTGDAIASARLGAIHVVKASGSIIVAGEKIGGIACLELVEP